MIIFLYGPDTFRSRQKLNEIVEHYKKVHKSGLNLKFFEGEDLRTSTERFDRPEFTTEGFSRMLFEDFRDEFQQISMFQGKKMLILRNIFSNREFKEKFLSNPKGFINTKNIILFYEKNEISSDDPLFIFLKKNAKSQEFKPLKGQSLNNWIKKRFESYKITIEPGVEGKLISLIGNDLWQMDNEIKKIIAYKKGEKIELKDIEILVRTKIKADIFKTIDAMALGDKKRALELLHKHLEKGDSPSYLLSMINFQFRNIIEVKDMIERNKSYSTILREAQFHPFVIKKSYNLAKKFTFKELKKIYQKIFQVDLNIKTGKLNPEIALDLLIAEI